MILRFGTSNWMSIRDYHELSLVATKLKDVGVVLSEGNIGIGVLPSVAIYGANASGKSNFITALRFLCNFVSGSFTSGKPGSAIGVVPFKLDPAYEKRPSRFDIDFVHRGIRFEFLVELNSERVLKEELNAYPQNRRQLWYMRDNDSFEFGKSLKGENKTIQGITRENSLFISAAATSNHELLTDLSRFFSDCVEFYTTNSGRNGIVDPHYKKYWDEGIHKQRILKLLQAADIGIADFEIQSTEPTEADKEFIRRLNSVLSKFLKTESDSGPFANDDVVSSARRSVRFKHLGAVGNIALESFAESRGTREYLNLLAPTLDALEEGRALVVDEIATSLHPLISKKLIGLFHSHSTNPRNAQLIFTTHDTNLLDRGLLRRDQIWFAEKDVDGASCVYPLSDIKTRSGDNIERGYLMGRYGAVPFVGDFGNLFEEIPREKISGPAET